MLVRFIRGNWKAFPKPIKDCLYNLVYLYSERAPFTVECLDRVTDEVFSQVESESAWFKDNIEEGLKDIKAGRVSRKPEGMSLSEWLSSLLDED